MSATNDVKEAVREKYGQAALRVEAGQAGCCGSAPRASNCCDPITSNFHETEQTDEVPDAALKASLGCGDARRGALRRDAFFASFAEILSTSPATEPGYA